MCELVAPVRLSVSICKLDEEIFVGHKTCAISSDIWSGPVLILYLKFSLGCLVRSENMHNQPDIPTAPSPLASHSAYSDKDTIPLFSRYKQLIIFNNYILMHACIICSQ